MEAAAVIAGYSRGSSRYDKGRGKTDALLALELGADPGLLFSYGESTGVQAANADRSELLGARSASGWTSPWYYHQPGRSVANAVRLSV